MAVVREPMVMYDGGFVDADASALDALGYAGGNDALLGGVDASALFDFGGYAYAYAYAHDEPTPTGAYLPTTASWAGAGSSVLTFDLAARGHGDQTAVASVVADEEADGDAWIDAMHEDGKAAPASTIGFDPASGCFSLTQRPGGARRPFGLLFPGTSNDTATADAAAPALISQKRTNVVRMQLDPEPRAAKRQCGASKKTSKPKAPTPPSTSSPNKDPQSLTAKNRREKISERLRTLQELVPNGTKVDMVTMLEKAVSYVKFLQLQVKVLATDEFWPAQGGMAPEISQVKEALDAILSSSSPSSQRGQRN